MSSVFSRHPEQDLVPYLDGELSARSAGKVHRHLESCGQCRAELEDFKDTLAEYTRDRRIVPATPAPQPWRDLYRDFSRIDEALANDSLLVRLTRPLVHSGAPRWSFVAGLAVLIVLLSLNQFRQAPSVQAASILRKAVAVAQTKPRAAHRIRVRTSHQREFSRMAVAQTALLQVAEAQAVASLFQAAHFDWTDPLSAQAFEQWHNAQVRKTDEVSTVQNPQAPSENFTQIRTVAPEGSLASASITFDTTEYPVDERLEFRDGEWVELNEIAETSTESAGGSVANRVEVPARAAEPPSRPAALTPGPSASISDEIQVLSKLSQIEADLGDPVEVSLSDGRVKVVGGEGISPRRQNQIRTTLASIPLVDVEFSPSVAAVSPADAVAAPNTGSATGVQASPIQARLEKHLGGHAEFDRFSTQLLDLDDAAMQRVYALRRLAQKFPPGDEAKLTAADLTLLHEMSRKHTDVLAEKVGAMEQMLVPTLSSLGGTASNPAIAPHNGWQPAAEDVYRNARRVEVLVSQMLGISTGDASPSELLIALKALRGNLDDCRKLQR